MLNKQTLTIPLGLGVNTKTDEKLVEQGAFNLVCENAVFDKVGAVKKRQSYKTLTTNYYNQASAAGTAAQNYTSLTYSPTCLATLGKSAFMRNLKGEYWYSHENAFIFNNTNPIPEVRVKSIPLYSCATTIDHSDTDYDSYENMIIAVGREGNLGGDATGRSSNGSTLVLYDLDTETKVVTNKIPWGGSAANAFGFVRCGFTRVGGVSYYYNITVDTSSTLRVRIFNKYGQENSTTINIASVRPAFNVNFHGIAVCRSGDDQTMFILVNTTTTNLGRFIAISGTTVTFNTTFSTTLAFMTSMTAKFSSSLVNLVYDNRRIIFNPNGTVNTADAAVSGMSLNSVAYDQDSTSRVFGRSSGSYAAWDSGTQNIENNNTFLMSDKVTISDLPIVIGRSSISFDPAIEESYFVLGFANTSGRSGQKTYARFCTSQALTLNFSMSQYYDYILARFAKVSSSKAFIALPKFNGQINSNPSYRLELFSFEVVQDYKSNSRSIIGKNNHLSGGFISEFDGVDLLENGFHTPPRMPSLNVSGGSALTGTFSYVLVAKHADKNGQVTRSAPSNASSTGAITSKDVVITLTTTPFGVRSKNCSIEIYRTTNGGSVYYYVNEVAVDMYSGSTIALFTDTASDAVISTNAILYTAGNILANDPSPACTFLFSGGNRLFAVGLEDENEIAYSKKKLLGESVAFSDFFRIRFDTAQFSTTGGCVAGGYLDGKVIIFKSNSIFYFTGDGPNETGAGNTFTDPELISSDTGCTDPRSVVLTPIGLFFKGAKGIYLLDRGLSVKYIGSSVEEFNSYNVTSACHIDEKNHVIFSLLSSNTNQKYQLCYDYFTEQWSVFTNLRALDADVLDGDHVVLDSALKAPQRQSGTDFLDNSTGYAMKVVTPWIKVSGIQDYGRIWKAYVLGRFKSAHTLIVKACYDYSEGYSETFTISPSISDGQYQYSTHFRKQKCESIKLEIYDSSIVGESMELTALTFEVGTRQGAYKLPASRKY
jgi:hypothetical protein